MFVGFEVSFNLAGVMSWGVVPNKPDLCFGWILFFQPFQPPNCDRCVKPMLLLKSYVSGVAASDGAASGGAAYHAAASDPSGSGSSGFSRRTSFM